VLHAASFALVFVALMEYVKERAEPGILGTAQGVLTATHSVGATLGMLLWGTLYAAHGGRFVFQGLALVASLGCLVVIVLEMVTRARGLGWPRSAGGETAR
jgi:ABC-type nitrate/sulfonate/bicarbonate transport system permease component